MKYLRLFEDWKEVEMAYQMNEGLQDWVNKFKQALQNPKFKEAISDIEKNFDSLDLETKRKLTEIDANKIIQKTNEELFNFDILALVTKIFYFVLNTKNHKQMSTLYKIGKSIKTFVSSEPFREVCNNFNSMETSEKLVVVVSLMIAIFSYLWKRDQKKNLQSI